MLVGAFGRVVFTTSRFRTLTYSGMSRSGAARWSEHEIIGMKPQLEFVGPGLDTISFNMRLDAAHGVNPFKMLEQLRQMRDDGISAVLILGPKYIGNFVIESLDENHKHQTGLGSLLVAEVAIALKEDVFIL